MHGFANGNETTSSNIAHLSALRTTASGKKSLQVVGRLLYDQGLVALPYYEDETSRHLWRTAKSYPCATFGSGRRAELILAKNIAIDQGES